MILTYWLISIVSVANLFRDTHRRLTLFSMIGSVLIMRCGSTCLVMVTGTKLPWTITHTWPSGITMRHMIFHQNFSAPNMLTTTSLSRMVSEIRWKCGWASGPSRLITVLTGSSGSTTCLLQDRPNVLRSSVLQLIINALKVHLILTARLMRRLIRMGRLELINGTTIKH